MNMDKKGEAIPKKAKVCCKDYDIGTKSIINLTSFAHVHGLYYSGKTFKFCPFCGRKIREEA